MHISDATQAASEAVQQSQSFIFSQIHNRTGEIGRQMSSTAEGLRRVAGELRDANAPGAPELTLRGADALDRAGRYLQDTDTERLLADAESFARERPIVVLAGALIAGFAASRMLKAASAQRYQSYGYAGDDDREE